MLEADSDTPAAGRAVLDSGRASESVVDLLQVWGQCSVQYWLPVHSEWSQPSVWQPLACFGPFSAAVLVVLVGYLVPLLPHRSELGGLLPSSSHPETHSRSCC